MFYSLKTEQKEWQIISTTLLNLQSDFYTFPLSQYMVPILSDLIKAYIATLLKYNY